MKKVKSESQKELTYLPYLDGWRGIAIIMVLLGHFTNLGATYELGRFGVSVFFVLSGFLMSRILFIKKVPLSIFYRRRFARILPAFLLYVFVVFLGGWLFLNEFHQDEFFSTVFFLRTYFPDSSIFKSYIPIGHLWSLNVEEHCYIILSLVSLLAIRFSELMARITLTICSILCVIFFIFYQYNPPAIYQSLAFSRTEVAAFPLLLSCSIFLWLNKFPIKIPSIVPVITLMGALSLAPSATLTTSLFSYITISALLAISVNTLNFAPKWIITILSNTVLRWFGICSYSIYLWQQIFYLANRYTKDWIFYDRNYYFIVGIFASILVGSFSFYFFEQPVRKWLSGKKS